MPGDQPEISSIEQKPVSNRPSYNLSSFNSQLDKYKNKKVSQGPNPVFASILAVPKFVINWLKVYEPRWRTILALLVLFTILSTVFFVGSSLSHAASFTFVQNDWTGGVSASTAAHPANQSSWNKFSAQTNADTSSSTVKTSTYTNNFTETFDTTTYKDAANSPRNTTVSDTFTGSNGTALHSHAPDIGSAWDYDAGVGDATLLSNQVEGSAHAFTLSWNGVASSSADYDVSMDINWSGTNTGADQNGMIILAVTGRTATDNSARYVAQYSISDQAWELIDWHSGSGTTIGSYSQSYVQGQTHNVKLSMVGTAIKVYVDGTQRISVTNSSVSAAGYPGIFTQSNGDPAEMLGDNFLVTGGGAWNGTGQLTAGTAQSLTVDTTSNNIRAATLTKDDTVGSGTITYYLSNDGGTTFTQVTPGSQLVFGTTGSDLRFKVISTGNATVQDLSISYTGYNATADLTSSAYNTGDAHNLVTKLAWSASGVTGSETLKFQIRTAPDSSGSPGTWSGWCGSADTGSSCTGSNFFNTSDNNVTISTSNPLRNNNDDQWFQYKMFFGTDSLATATLSSITITYVVNAPPQFNPDYPTTAAGGVSVAQDTTSSSPTFGKVLINYSVRDTDTSTGTANPGFITPSFEYNIGGGWISITSGNLAAGDTSNKAVDGVSYTTYTATWNATAQIAGNYTTSAQVRVTANDNEGANNTAQATSANFTLDTKNPVISVFTIDASQSQLAINSTDDTNLQYLVSNNSDYSADGLNSTSGQYQSAGGNSINLNPSWVLATMTYPTVYLKVRDNAGNITTAKAVAPSTPTNMDIKDISNTTAGSWRQFVSWEPFTPTTGSAFFKYEVYRSTDGSSYSLISTISDVNINYYADFGLTHNQLYYYKVRVIDTDGDISNYSSVISHAPSGQGGTDTTPPTITAVTVTATQSTTATITWTTDELATSEIDYSVAPSTTFATGQTNSSFLLSHNLTLTGLTPNTSYLFEVKSTDAVGNIGTNDNSAAGFSFNTLGGPVISNVTETSINVHTATIVWNTDKDSDSFVTYSTSPSLSSSTKVGSAALIGGSAPYQHSVSLSNLTPGATYYFFVESKDANANDTQDNNGGNYYTLTTTIDTTPPVISGISAPVISETSAAIIWTTDEPATSQVSYGANSGTYTTTTTLDSTLTTFHLVALSGLVASTKYYFVVTSADQAGNSATSTENSLTTSDVTVVTIVTGGGGGGAAAPVVLDTTPPKITNVKIDSITPFGATVTFTTDEDASALVQYSTDKTKFNQGVGTSDFSKDHTISLAGLTMATPYFVQVQATDKSGNVATSTDIQTFTTLTLSEGTAKISDIYQFQQQIQDAIQSALPSLVPPFVEKPQITDITDTSATVSWSTNIKSYGIVDYATDSEYDTTKTNPYPGEVSDVTNKDTVHTMQLANLTPNTVYHLAVRSFYLPDIIGTSKDITFTTKAANVKALISKVTNNSFTVSWNTNDATTSVVDYRDIKSANTQEQSDPATTTSHHIDITGLTPGTTYTVSVYGINAKGNRVETAASLTVRTSVDTTPPQILGLKIDTAIVPGATDTAQTIVSWKTDEPSTSTVYYEEGAGTGSADSQKPLTNKVEITTSYVLDHAIVLTTLKPGGLYRIQVGSTDTAGNVTLLPVKTIVIPQQSQSILDIVFKNFEDTFQFLRQIGK